MTKITAMFLLTMMLTACANTSTPVSDVTVGPDEAYVQTDLGRLYVKAVGNGSTTVVLWPSIFTDHKIYDALATELQDHYRFLLIDGPGHGRSEGIESEFTIGQSAEAMVAVLDYYRIDKAVIGGTSWGGLTAAELSLSQPDRVRALVMMNTPMEIDGRNPSMSARFISFGARHGLRFGFMRNGIARSFFTPSVLTNNPDYATNFHSMLRQANSKHLSAAVRSVILRGKPLKDRLSDISVPALVVAGKDDTMYPIQVQSKAAQHLPNGEFVVVEGKHISVIEQPISIARTLMDFIDRKALQ